MPGTISRYKITGTIAAGGGFTAYTNKPIRGKIKSIEIDYPAANVTLVLTSEGPIAQTVLNLGAANTDVVRYPRIYQEDEAGTDLTYDATRKIPTEFVVIGRLKLVASSGTATQVVTMYINVEEY